uniref:Ribosomal protein L32 n=1 Tax=Pteridomonas sp. YPF1301 TaxID=2766739 RepID=A0A7G1MQR4_9STRA|nr:ribosomal protein L32 [Pteridomonas sp. YPF1301]
MAVPKKRTSLIKKRHRHSIWVKHAQFFFNKAFLLSSSVNYKNDLYKKNFYNVYPLIFFNTFFLVFIL